MKTKPCFRNATLIARALAVFCLTATNTWARSARSRQLVGKVETVDRDARTLKGLGSSFASLVAVVALLAACSKKTETTADAKAAKPATEAKAAAIGAKCA